MIVNGAPYRGYDLRLNADQSVAIWFYGDHIDTVGSFDEAKELIDTWLIGY